MSPVRVARALAGAAEAGPRATLLAVAPGLFVLVVFVLAGLMFSPYGQYIAVGAVITALVALSLGVVTGRAGVISLGQMGFAGLGAWVMLWLNVHASEIPFLISAFIAGLAMLPVSLLLSLPALRLRGINLAIITLAFAVTVGIIFSVHGFPGSSQGIALLRPDFLASDQSYFWACAVIFGLFGLALAVIDRIPIGASWLAVKHSERAAAALGRSVARAKLSAFALSAFIAGVAGALLAGQLGIGSGQSFTPIASITIFAVAVMLSARFIEGALMVGAIMVFLPELLRTIEVSPDYGIMLFAVGAVLGLKGGAGLAEAIRTQLRARFTRVSGEGNGRTFLEPEIETVGAGSTDGYSPTFSAAVAGVAPTDSDALPALEITDLEVNFGLVKALDKVTFSVPTGIVTALIGPNGAGKSTLIDCVSGFYSRYGGEIRVAGRSVNHLRAHLRAQSGLRRTFQHDHTISELTAERYMRLSLSKSSNSVMSAGDIRDLLAYFGCESPRRYISEMDVGMRRLVEVAAAVAAKPEVVLLDEPAAGLPSEVSRELARKIAEIPNRFGSAVLLVEHDMELVAQAASKVVVLDFGVVIAAGSPAEVLADDKVIKAYLGEEITV